jgi:hypothetical protein
MAEPTQGVTLFRRNLTINPFIIPVGLTASPIEIGKTYLETKGVTSFKMYNPNPFWVWYRGWNGNQTPIPTIKEMGHYIGPGMVDINRSQVPDWIAAVADSEPNFPVTDAQGNWLFTGQRTRLIMIYGSGG